MATPHLPVYDKYRGGHFHSMYVRAHGLMEERQWLKHGAPSNWKMCPVKDGEEAKACVVAVCVSQSQRKVLKLVDLDDFGILPLTLKSHQSLWLLFGFYRGGFSESLN